MNNSLRKFTAAATLSAATCFLAVALSAAGQQTPVPTETTAPVTTTTNDSGQHFDYGILGLIGLIGLGGLMRRSSAATVDYSRTPRA